jgi:hypothetical protein
MKRRIAAILVAGALMAVGAAPAFGDAGAAGTTFPEQPGTNGQTACEMVRRIPVAVPVVQPVPTSRQPREPS